uniref:Uncharacterized protein n=1 Tax=mine drainage metagenome TaxID=410659 RepID=E6PIL2_9ZZZZ
MAHEWHTVSRRLFTVAIPTGLQRQKAVVPLLALKTWGLEYGSSTPNFSSSSYSTSDIDTLRASQEGRNLLPEKGRKCDPRFQHEPSLVYYSRRSGNRGARRRLVVATLALARNGPRS